MILTRCVPALLLFFLFSFTPVKKYVRKAESRMERGDLKAAQAYYGKALRIDSTYYPANLGLGLLYSEFLEDHEKALPYLERAFNAGINDSLPELVFALAKCYHQREDYERALGLYDQLAADEELREDKALSAELSKRASDCRYALSKMQEKPDTGVYLVNAGPAINTGAPEYVPVLRADQALIFTSKRKDNKQEKLSRQDGKYFEAMYIAEAKGNGFSDAKPFHLADRYLTRRSGKHESVVSLSQDGKTLFTFRRGNIYRTDAADQNKKPEPLIITGHKRSYQSHAFLSRDGNTLYFTSDVKGGLGGTDIYRSSKKADGSWALPENLGEPVNTAGDEDAPYISPQGDYLYFASKGHPGYGNYDLFRAAFSGNGFAPPENLGKPFNSPANDIFFVSDSTQAIAYFASGRNGGAGDLDIYKVLFLDKFEPVCPAADQPLAATRIKKEEMSAYANTIQLEPPAGFRPLRTKWAVNGQAAASNDPVSFYHNYEQPGSYTVSYVMVAHCDTCTGPAVLCHTLVNTIGAGLPADSLKKKETRDPLAGQGTKPAGLQLNGFDDTPVYFDFDGISLKAKEKKRLEGNIVLLRENPGILIQLYGHADSRGADAYNRRLSKRRALMVKQYLIKNGIAESRFLEITGRGSSELANHCSKGVKCSEKQHAMNRRVNIILSRQE